MKPEFTSTSLDYSRLFKIANIVTSIGIILVTSGGSWDITNHILNKPETFFAPPHAMLYSGVGIALLGFTLLFVSWQKSQKPSQFSRGIKITTIGIASLLAAGPIDFVWHSTFGLDGLLSPPHLVLIAGMGLTSIGALANAKVFLKGSEKPSRFIIVVSMIPVWFSVTGLFYSFSLPFSKTDYFDFNPNPIFAAGFAAVAYPFLVTVILASSAILSKKRFGVASLVGASYLGIMTLSAVIPNHTLIHTIPFYLANIIPIILGDYVLSRSKTTKHVMLAGAIFGSIFYFLYYPLITYTYNEITLDKLMWPSLTSQIYFELVPLVAPFLIISGGVVGALGVRFAQKITS
ncbi:hypothetical protein [Candidatus Nitrosotenuis cloacae]|uniref:Ammonia monooxygenase n=1 Tax=Candidatus Nitrosotenuis cloacae TaxID=1603555 RepID=A0A3G1B158_9ARCH|nr:hypothetical protein [Candidatus Nitrosotenuis cloacae]AJZ75864.1 hypothetical protein SU86_005235 [Candidatus Nitrosotenuis cloacae]